MWGEEKGNIGVDFVVGEEGLWALIFFGGVWGCCRSSVVIVVVGSGMGRGVFF